MKRKSHAGITSMMLPIFVVDTSSSTGAGLSGLVFGTSGLVAEYRRQGQATWTAITLVTATLGTYTSSGFIVDGSLAGSYELGVPNAAVAAGARWVAIRLYGATNMKPVLIEIELDAVDYQDASAFGLVNITNNTPQTGDNYTRIGVAGAGLTALAPAATALSTAQWTNARAANLDNLDAAVSTRSTYAGGAVASVTAAVTISTSQALGAPRALDAIADASLTINDALHCAIAAASGKETKVGTVYTIMTPSTGTVLRTFTLDSSTAPTSRT